jgi:hypothetical protein
LDRPRYVREAKRRGYSCGVATAVGKSNETCFQDEKACNNDQLCEKASFKFSGGRLWHTVSHVYGVYVIEAKRRGLGCGVSETGIIKTAFENLSVLKRKQIQYALKKLNYYRSSIDALYGPSTEQALINFAKFKGLDTNEPEKVFKNALRQVDVPVSFVSSKPSKACYREPNLCNNDQLCEKASFKFSGGRLWHHVSQVYGIYVAEAKRRGLTCGVK